MNMFKDYWQTIVIVSTVGFIAGFLMGPQEFWVHVLVGAVIGFTGFYLHRKANE